MPAQAAVVVGGEKGERKVKAKRLRVPGGEELGLLKTDQDPRRTRAGFPRAPWGALA